MGKPSVPTIKPTAQELQQFEINKGKWDNYQQYGIPAQNELIRRTITSRTNPDGSVKTDAGQAIAASQKQWADVLNRPVNPNGGAGRTGVVGLLTDKMGSDARIESQTRYGQQLGYLSALENAMNMGRGLQGDALQGMGNLTQLAAQQAANDAQTSFNQNLQNQTAMGGVLGMMTPYAMQGVQTVAKDGSYINGAYDKALTGWFGRLGG